MVSDTTSCNWQQLLAIWRRAKGKERDALLWGDEVNINCMTSIHIPMFLVSATNENLMHGSRLSIS